MEWWQNVNDTIVSYTTTMSWIRVRVSFAFSSMLRHGSYPVQTTGEIKPVLIQSNAVFIPGGAKNLPQTKFGILKLLKVNL